MMNVLTEAERILAGIASPAMSVVDSKAGIVLATVREPTPSGSIHTVQFYNPVSGLWQDSAPTIDLGQSGGIQCWGKNTSQYRLNMRVDFKVTSPSGAVSTKTGSVYTIDAGSNGAWSWTFLCNEVGQYKVDITLYAEYAA